jgi:cell division septal protein FtsQ
LAKKKKRGDSVRFRFDNEDGDKKRTINLFDDDESEDDYKPQEELHNDEANAPDDAPEADAPSASKDKPGSTPTFHFDRYGRRIGKRGARYGKRKNAPKATTTVVEHDTEAKREYDEARARAEARAKKRAREEAKQAELKRAERKKKRRRGASTLILGILALVGFAVLTWFITRVGKVRVTNVPNGYTEEQIIELSGLSSKIGKRSALFIRTADVEKRINANDPYLDATVRYTFPSTITITVSKRDEAACVRWGPQNEYLAIIDENGTVLNAQAEGTNGLLIADGMNISSAVNGTRLGDQSDIQVAALIRLLSKLKELGLLERTPKINQIDMTELMQIHMGIDGYPYTIEVGDTSNLETKLMLLQKHWTEIMDEASGFIRIGKKTVTIYLYSKGGVTVSPYEPGAPASVEPTASPSVTPGDDGQQQPSEPSATPSDEPYEPAPQVTPMPHQGDPFTG